MWDRHGHWRYDWIDLTPQLPVGDPIAEVFVMPDGYFRVQRRRGEQCWGAEYVWRVEPRCCVEEQLWCGLGVHPHKRAAQRACERRREAIVQPGKPLYPLQSMNSHMRYLWLTSRHRLEKT